MHAEALKERVRNAFSWHNVNVRATLGTREIYIYLHFTVRMVHTPNTVILHVALNV